MVLLDLLKTGYELVSGSGKKKGGSMMGGLFGKVTEMFGGGKNPEAITQANEVRESSENERAGLGTEIFKSVMLREFPRLSAINDLGRMATGNKAPEVVPWQNEFETLTSLLLLLPNKWKKPITDFILDKLHFRKIFEYWPGLDGIGGMIDLPLIGKTGALNKLPGLGFGEGGPIRQRIMKGSDPDAVIEALRVIHQDVFVTGKVSFDKLKELTGGNASALAILGLGAGALTAGSAMIGGPSESAPQKSIDSQGNTVIVGKKISEYIKKNPEKPHTNMQSHLAALLTELGVMDNAELVNGEWEDNNDEVTVSFLYDGAKYYLTFDDDVTKTDLILKTSDGRQILDTYDMWGFEADWSAKKIREAIAANPGPAEPVKKPEAKADAKIEKPKSK